MKHAGACGLVSHAWLHLEENLNKLVGMEGTRLLYWLDKLTVCFLACIKSLFDMSEIRLSKEIRYTILHDVVR